MVRELSKYVNVSNDKFVDACPMSKEQFARYKDLPQKVGEVDNSAGFHCVHGDGKDEWIGVNSFEELYSPLQNCHIKTTSLNFGTAFELAKKGLSMRLPAWSPDVLIRVQFPDDGSKMTAPYLYVASRFGMVPWKETNIELFSEEWEIV
jgi:hypothetical protein